MKQVLPLLCLLFSLSIISIDGKGQNASVGTMNVTLLTAPTSHDCSGVIRFEYETCNCLITTGWAITVNGYQQSVCGYQSYHCGGTGVCDILFAPGEYDIVATLAGGSCSNTGEVKTFHISIPNPPCTPPNLSIVNTVKPTGYGCNNGSITVNAVPTMCGIITNQYNLYDSNNVLIRTTNQTIYTYPSGLEYTFAGLPAGEYKVKATTSAASSACIGALPTVESGPIDLFVEPTQASTTANLVTEPGPGGCLRYKIEVIYGDQFNQTSCAGAGGQTWTARLEGTTLNGNDIDLQDEALYGQLITFNDVTPGDYTVTGRRVLPGPTQGNDAQSISIPGPACGSTLTEISRTVSPKGIGCDSAALIEFEFTSTNCYTTWTLTEASSQLLGFPGTWTANKGQRIFANIPAAYLSTYVYEFVAYSNGDPLLDCPATATATDIPTLGCDGTVTDSLTKPISTSGASDAEVSFMLTTSSCLDGPWTVVVKDILSNQQYFGQALSKNDTIVITGLHAGNYTYGFEYLGTDCSKPDAGAFSLDCTTITLYRDNDGDGFGDPNNDTTICSLSIPFLSGYSGNSDDSNDNLITYSDNDGDGFGFGPFMPFGIPDNTDFDDNCITCYPGAPELCDGFDNNGDNVTDAIVTTGIICGTANEGVNLTLTAPPGLVFTAVEFASYGTPNGTCGNFTIGTCHATNSLSIVQGMVIGQNSISIPASHLLFGDPCIGTNKRLYVQARYYDSISLKSTFYADTDGDGFGNPADSQIVCSQPPGYILNNTDCDDNNGAVNPAIIEICNGIDDNCDGFVDSTYMNGLVVYLPMNGNATDASGNGLNGTINGTLTGVTDRFGNANSAMSFPGTGNSYITISDNPQLRPSSFTLSLWALVSSNPFNNFMNKSIISGCNNDSWYFGTYNSDYGVWNANSAACGDYVNIFAPKTVGQWKHVVFTLDDVNNIRRMYVDGVQVATGPYTATVAYDGNPVVIGAKKYTDGTFRDLLNGILDDVMIFNRAISNTEVNTLFVNGNPLLPLTVTYYADADGDGFGNAAVTQVACIQPPGYVLNNTDCNDNSAAAYTGATEICDGIDNDCDGNTDTLDNRSFICGMATSEGQSFTLTAPPGQVFISVDFASYGTPNGTCGNFTLGGCHATNTMAIVQGLVIGQNSVTLTQNYQVFGDPCIGVNKRFYVQARYANLVPLAQTYYADADGDGFGNPAVSQVDCNLPPGYVLNNTDCDDNNINVNPGVAEIPNNGIDDNCDGNTDGLATALHFDGANDHVSIPLNGNSLSQLTIECWFKKGNGASAGILQWASNNPSNNDPWILLRDYGSSVTLYSNDAYRMSATGLSVGTWYHIAVTYDGANWKMFLNGNPVGTSTSGIGSRSSSNIYVGNGYPTFWNGAMDELRIWNIARTQADIQSHMSCEIPGSQSNLIANYHFNQGLANADNTNPSINTLTDASGNNNTGTLNNFALNGASSNWIGPSVIGYGLSCIQAITLNLKLFLQGYYTGAGTMQPVLNNQAVPLSQATQTDSVTVELHDPTTLALVDAKKAVLSTTGIVSAIFARPPGEYYIAIRHRNTIETWSANPVVCSNTAPVYDFSTDANKAFGSNQFEVEPNVWAFYTGDLNQDDFIDGNDFPAFDTDSFNGVSNLYVATDMNGDGFVDGNDFPVFDNNSFNGVSSIYP